MKDKSSPSFPSALTTACALTSWSRKKAEGSASSRSRRRAMRALRRRGERRCMAGRA